VFVYTANLFKSSGGGTLGGTDTWLTMGSGLVGKTEFSHISSDHVELDFDVSVFLTGVDTNNRSDHFGKDNSVSEVSLDGGGLLTRSEVLLGLSELLNESLIFMLKTSAESSLDSGSEEFNEIFVLEGSKVFKGETSVGELLSGTFSSLIVGLYI